METILQGKCYRCGRLRRLFAVEMLGAAHNVCVRCKNKVRRRQAAARQQSWPWLDTASPRAILLRGRTRNSPGETAGGDADRGCGGPGHMARPFVFFRVQRRGAS